MVGGAFREESWHPLSWSGGTVGCRADEAPLLSTAVLWRTAQLAYGFLLIAGLMAVAALCFYVIWLAVMAVVSFLPMIGQRHRHARWDELNTLPPPPWRPAHRDRA